MELLGIAIGWILAWKVVTEYEFDEPYDTDRTAMFFLWPFFVANALYRSLSKLIK